MGGCSQAVPFLFQTIPFWSSGHEGLTLMLWLKKEIEIAGDNMGNDSAYPC